MSHLSGLVHQLLKQDGVKSIVRRAERVFRLSFSVKSLRRKKGRGSEGRGGFMRCGGFGVCWAFGVWRLLS
ncbi:hypothetical protein [Bartonella sp. AU15XJBT]|uniref:hypothetical protein n=1 Tax=Bartonella sp. AU15XJBT TaxID=3019087 RepID=UPI002360F511|nr:hypothetical protein [Bartonella sp. AU15XJBT]